MEERQMILAKIEDARKKLDDSLRGGDLSKSYELSLTVDKYLEEYILFQEKVECS